MKQTKQSAFSFPESQEPWETKGIFSDHYIRTRLKGSNLWPKDEEVKLVHELCKNLWNKLHIALGKGNEELTKREFLEPVLEKLGFAHYSEISLSVGGTPDYLLFADETIKESVLAENKATKYSAALLLLEAKKVNHPLGTVSKKETPGRFPHQQVRDYLQYATDNSGKAYFNWAILTNGNIWRLYCRDAHPSHYFEFNLEVAIRSSEDFRLFVALFSPKAFARDTENKCPLDHLREEALEHQVVLEDDLRKRVFNILEQLANGFYKRSENKISTDGLKKLYEKCLIFLYRLLFILYAEGRGLLPVKHKKYREDYSLQRLFIKLKDHRSFASDDFTDLYEDILRLFRLINSGNKACDVPEYNGGLFASKEYQELEDWRIGEYTLANVLRRLIAAEIPKGIGEQDSFSFGNTVDYAELEVRQLGSIYEGLLENHLEFSVEGISTTPVGGTSKSRTLILQGDKTERKATGTYYTPDYIVNYIVENTLGPLCKEIENSVRTDVEAKPKSRLGGTVSLPMEHPAMAVKDNSFANAVLKLKVLDPAMGSGHFLVRATEYLADQIVYHPTTVLQIKEATRGLSQEQEEIAYWRRKVVESCIYGVDLNPLAVELAKLSLWLSCIASDQPLSFLDHHLHPGNSLIGAKLSDLGGLSKERKTPLFDSIAPNLIKAVSSAIQKLKTIEETESKNVSVIKDKEKYWKEVKDTLQPYKDIANLWTSTFFGIKINELKYQEIARLMLSTPKPRTNEALKLKKNLEPLIDFQNIAKREMFFHWEYEFPEIFFDNDGAPKQTPGFDAVIGNPPWGAELYNEEYMKINYPYSSEMKEINSYLYFTEKGYATLKNAGCFGFIIPDTFLLKSQYKSFRNFLIEKTSIYGIIETGVVFEQAKATPTAILFFEKSQPMLSNSFQRKQLDYRKNVNSILDDLKNRNWLQEGDLTYKEWKTSFNLQLGRYIDNKKKTIIQKLVESKKVLPLREIKNIEIDRGIEGSKKVLMRKGEKGTCKILTPQNIYKYFINDKPEYFTSECKSSFMSDRILIIRIRNTKIPERIVASIENKKRATLKTIQQIYFRNKSELCLKYLLGVVNSNLINYYCNHFLVDDLNREYLLQLPIRTINFSNPADKKLHDDLVTLVNQILAITKDDDYLRNETKQTKVTDLEKQIDKMVYKLYDLTDEEIKTIRGVCK